MLQRWHIPSGLVASPSRIRRRLLIALVVVLLAAFAVMGTAGSVRYVSTFWLYRGFSAPSLPHSVVALRPGGIRRVVVVPPSLEKISVVSPALGGRADTVHVVLPPGYASHPGQRYPVVYLLHGFPGKPVAYLNIGGVEDLEATLVAAGRVAPAILVMPTGTFSFLTDEEWVNSVRSGNAWETFVARDLVKAIDARYRTIRSGSGRALAGYSEGGYAALNIGFHHPGEFGVLESWSGYMFAEDIAALFAHDPRLINYNSPAKSVVFVAPRLRAARTYIWFYAGASDELAPQNRAFAAELAALGIAHHFFEPPGSHTWRLWRDLMPRALITASEHLRHG